MADPNFKNRRTPGVYVSEISAFPPSAVGVDTAVPAFIGYTQRAEIAGVPAINLPVRIASMMQFEQYFGGSLLDVRRPGQAPAPKFTLGAVAAPKEGGAPAAGTYDVSYQSADGASTVYAKLAPIGDLFSLYNCLSLFYANGGGPCYIVSVGTYTDEAGAATPVTSAALLKGLESVKDTAGPTLLVIPDASLVPVGEYGTIAKAMMKQAHDKQDRAALLDVRQVRAFSATPGPELGDAITEFRASVGTDYLSYGMTYFPYLNTSVIKAADLDYTLFPAGELSDFLLAEWQERYPPGPASSADFAAVRSTLKEGWPDEKGEQALAPKLANVIQDLAERDRTGAQQLQFLVTRMKGFPTDPAGIRSRNQDLVNIFPELTYLLEKAARQFNLLPASAAMAGVMTVIDNTRGVWNAPANIALNVVDGPAFRINDETQADLNKPLDGKAINVIREFVGRGPIVWGARTLDGNSNDYRYVQVRRTLIYIEQSIKAAMNPFVFAPNDGKTWVAVEAMVSNFLSNLWARGGLMGTTPQEAFSVNCGLGTTMSAQDVLEGYMVVQVLVQMIHPAEYIELTFKQKMESVG